MRTFTVTLHLVVGIDDDTSDDDLEDAIADEVEAFSGSAIMIDYTEEIAE